MLILLVKRIFCSSVGEHEFIIDDSDVEDPMDERQHLSLGRRCSVYAGCSALHSHIAHLRGLTCTCV